MAETTIKYMMNVVQTDELNKNGNVMCLTPEAIQRIDASLNALERMNTEPLTVDYAQVGQAGVYNILPVEAAEWPVYPAPPRERLTRDELIAIRMKKSPPTTTKPMFLLLMRGNKQKGNGKDRSLVRYTPKTLKKYHDLGYEVYRVGDRVEKPREENE